MAKPKFSREEAVIVPHKDSKPNQFAGHGKVTNIFRINSRWLYEVEFSGGIKHQYEEKDIERKQLTLDYSKMTPMSVIRDVSGSMTKEDLEQGLKQLRNR